MLAELYAVWGGVSLRVVEELQRDGWELHPWIRNGETIGIASIQGTEVHFCGAPKWRGRLAVTRRALQDFFRPLFERRGYLTTRAYEGDHETRNFLERVGFKHTWADGVYDHFLLSELPFSKRG